MTAGFCKLLQSFLRLSGGGDNISSEDRDEHLGLRDQCLRFGFRVSG